VESLFTEDEFHCLPNWTELCDDPQWFIISLLHPTPIGDQITDDQTPSMKLRFGFYHLAHFWDGLCLFIQKYCYIAPCMDYSSNIIQQNDTNVGDSTLRVWRPGILEG
jgi:hypothetical protein